jgi:hypothetical protein
MKQILVTLLLMMPFQTMAKGTAHFVKPYLEIQSTLAADSMKGVNEQAVALEKALKQDHLSLQAGLVGPLKSETQIPKAREAFLKLNEKLVPWIKKHPQEGAELAYCPMKKASWLQKKGEIRNPYYGAEMLECGVKEDER